VVDAASSEGRNTTAPAMSGETDRRSGVDLVAFIQRSQAPEGLAQAGHARQRLRHGPAASASPA
jgi:hypothetical protein